MDDVVNFKTSSLYGAHTKQGIVEIHWGEFKTQLTILGAKKIAYQILESAEAVFKLSRLWDYYRNSFS